MSKVCRVVAGIDAKPYFSIETPERIIPSFNPNTGERLKDKSVFVNENSFNFLDIKVEQGFNINKFAEYNFHNSIFYKEVEKQLEPLGLRIFTPRYGRIVEYDVVILGVEICRGYDNRYVLMPVILDDINLKFTEASKKFVNLGYKNHISIFIHIEEED